MFCSFPLGQGIRPCAGPARCALLVLALVLSPMTHAAELQPTAITAVSLEAVRIHPLRSAPATVVSLNDSRISAEITATVTEITVRPGDTVEPDTLLIRLDCRDHELAAQRPAALLQAARAEKDLADFRFGRADSLHERGAIPLAELRERKAAALKSAAEVRRLQARVAESDRIIANCAIHAPFRAVVVERYASVGELVEPGTPLLRLVDQESLEISGNIQEQDLASLRAARRIEFVSHDRHYPVWLRSVVPVLDSRIGSYEVRFLPTGEKPAPGETGRIDWRASHGHVPASLLVRRRQAFGVFIAVDGQARFVPIEGARPGRPAATTLPGDTQLVVDGRYGLDDGEAITIVPPTIETVPR